MSMTSSSGSTAGRVEADEAARSEKQQQTTPPPPRPLPLPLPQARTGGFLGRHRLSAAIARLDQEILSLQNKRGMELFAAERKFEASHGLRLRFLVLSAGTDLRYRNSVECRNGQLSDFAEPGFLEGPKGDCYIMLYNPSSPHLFPLVLKLERGEACILDLEGSLEVKKKLNVTPRDRYQFGRFGHVEQTPNGQHLPCPP
uniref:Uncharacterized protein n=1 Tax=Ananas comosus var. bracteatus TaxID=296719 RepID=A0A6V7P9H4_ANACO|nr:unnamed protein product [Ananas comosus var. bracteatus]